MYDPLYYAAAILTAVAALLLARWYFGRRQIATEAREDWEVRQERSPGTIKGVDQETFEGIFIAAHEPRWSLYAAGTLFGVIIISPIAGVFLMWVWPLFTSMLDGGPWYDVGYYPWMFYMFFGMVALWAGVGFVASRLFYARRPEEFRAALARARGEPLDDVVIPRARPAWARRVRPDPKPDTDTANEKASE
ncbi:hypothetical protein [Maricaulis sp.]|uniref:hypothetical protein n=1 Tax=Maricaulis sp. TaxID=1486257 RepID=UPI002609B608|nr:hypothetical protein [Maricaulis sp.]